MPRVLRRAGPAAAQLVQVVRRAQAAAAPGSKTLVACHRAEAKPTTSPSRIRRPQQAKVYRGAEQAQQADGRGRRVIGASWAPGILDDNAGRRRQYVALFCSAARSRSLPAAVQVAMKRTARSSALKPCRDAWRAARLPPPGGSSHRPPAVQQTTRMRQLRQRQRSRYARSPQARSAYDSPPPAIAGEGRAAAGVVNGARRQLKYAPLLVGGINDSTTSESQAFKPAPGPVIISPDSKRPMRRQRSH